MADPVPAVPAAPVYSKVAWPMVIGLIFAIAVNVAHQLYPVLDLSQVQGYIQVLITGATGYAVNEAVK